MNKLNMNWTKCAAAAWQEMNLEGKGIIAKQNA